MKIIEFKEMLASTILVTAIICLLVAPLYESRELIQVAIIVAFSAFWVGVLSAQTWAIREWALSSLTFPLIDRDNKLHPLMSIGECYSVVTPPGELRGRVYLLQSENDLSNPFLVLTSSNFRLPHYFCVKKGASGDGSSLFFEPV